MKNLQRSEPTPRRILRRPGLLAKVGLSYPTIWRYECDGKFPQRVQLGRNSVGWFEDEIEEWLRTRQRGALPVETLNVPPKKFEGLHK